MPAGAAGDAGSAALVSPCGMAAWCGVRRGQQRWPQPGCPPPAPAPLPTCRCCAAPALPSRTRLQPRALHQHCAACVHDPASDRLRGGGADTGAPESFTWWGGARAVGRAAAKTARRPCWGSNSHRGRCGPLKFRPTDASELIRHTFQQAQRGQKAGNSSRGVWRVAGMRARRTCRKVREPLPPGVRLPLLPPLAGGAGAVVKGSGTECSRRGARSTAIMRCDTCAQGRRHIRS